MRTPRPTLSGVRLSRTKAMAAFLREWAPQRARQNHRESERLPVNQYASS
jgi:hypothetical protein